MVVSAGGVVEGVYSAKRGLAVGGWPAIFLGFLFRRGGWKGRSCSGLLVGAVIQPRLGDRRRVTPFSFQKKGGYSLSIGLLYLP